MPVSQQVSSVTWALVIGAALIVIIWAVIRGAWWRKATNDVLPAEDAAPEPVQPVHEYPEGLAEAHGPVPLIVKIVIVSFVAWTIVYVILFARAGFTFG